jgi:hypothetical protein
MAYNFNQISGDNVTAAGMAYRASETGGISFNNPLSGGGDGRLVLPIWAGEVINAYDQYNIFEGLVDSRTITSGTTMEFPVTGYVAINPVWSAGEELIGGIDNKATTFRVTLDKRPIASHFELDNIDLMLTQWEYRSELARQAGRSLSDARDRQIGAYIARAAGEGVLTGDPRATDEFGYSAVGGLGGKVFCNSNFDHLGNASSTAAQRTDAALKLLEKIEEFQIRLQEVDAPTDGVFCAVSPRTFQDIRALGVARVVADLAAGAGRPLFGGVAEAGGLGAGLQQGMFNLADRLEYQGVSIIKTNHLPDKDYSTTARNIGEARYNRTFSVAPVKALIWQQSCVAALKLMGLKVDQVDDVRRNTVFTVASMMAGTGTMKPEHAAVCIGTPAKDAGGDNGDGDIQFATSGVVGAATIDTVDFSAAKDFGVFSFDSNGDISTFEESPDAGSPTVVTATTDAAARALFNAAISSSAVCTNGGATANSSFSNHVAMALEYVDSPNAGIFRAADGNDTDGLGTDAS